MRDSHYRITLDITKTQSQVSLSAKQGDTSRKIYINLVEGSQPYDIDGTKCTAVFHGVKSDGTKLEEYCIIEGDKIRYDFTEQTTAAVGLVECDITLHSIETGVIASPHFNIIVDNRAIEPDVLSEDQAMTFDEVLTEFGDIRNAEAQRVSNESNRIESEAQRVSNEQTRIANEEERKANEEIRKKAAQSLANLNNRVTTAENERETAEAERQEAEKDRQDMWNNSIENPKVWELNPGCYYVSGMVSITSELAFPVYEKTILYIAPDDTDENNKRFVLFLGYAHGMPFDVLTGTTDGETEEFYIVETDKNKTNKIDKNSTDEQYPTAKAVFDALLAQAIDIKIEPIGDEVQAVTVAMEDTPTVMSLSNTDTADTKVTLTVPDDKLRLDIRGVYTYNDTHCDVTRIDWGDGSSTDIKGATDDEMKHDYTAGGTYTITLVGMTTFAGFNDKNVLGFELGSIVTEVTKGAASSNPNLTEIVVYAVTPPPIGNASSTSYAFGNQVTRVTVPNDSYLTTLGWSMYSDVIYIDSSLNGDSGDSGEGGDTPGGDTGGGDDSGDSGNENPGGSTDVVSGSGYKLIITTAEGTETLYLYQGQQGNDGKDGANGKDGVSPTIEVKEIEGGNRLTITDKNGTQSVDILNGEQGESNLQVTNMVSNGNFVDSTGWSVLSGNTLSVEENTAVLTNNGSSGYIGMSTNISSAEGFTGHVLFAKVNIEVEKYTNTVNQYKFPIVQIYNNSAGMSYAVAGEGQDLEQDYYGTMTATIAAGKSIGITWRASYNATSTFASGKTCKFKNALIVDLTEVFGAGNEPTADEFYALLNALDNKWFEGTINLLDTSLQIKRISDNQITSKDIVVTVGAGGDFATINKAMQYLSRYYPAYKKGGLNCEIRILDGTVIDEQIIVERADFSYISITSENADNTVIVTPTAVNWSKGTLTHDTRGNLPFFGGEFGARLPVIKCLFKLETGNENNTVFIQDTYYPIVGYYCNRGSMGVIAGETTSYTGSEAGGLVNVGFENFYDNVIANNNSEIVLREAIARNAGRYGVMARHISRVSARSADITGCADTAAYADRSSMMDVRFADVSGSNNGLQCFNTSNMTAVETIAKNITNIVADSREGSVINCAEMTIDNVKDVFKVLNGGTIIATSTSPTNVSGSIHSKAINTLDANGVIYG